MFAPTTAAHITLDAQLPLKVAGPLAGTTQTHLRFISLPSESDLSNLRVPLTPLSDVTAVWRGWCRSVSTGRLSEQPIRITLGGQAYQGSTDSLNTERPMETGTVPWHHNICCWNAAFKWKAKLCALPKSPAGPSVQPQGGSASPRTVLFTVGSPPKSSTPPTCSHLGTRPRTTSGGYPPPELVKSQVFAVKLQPFS